MHVLRWRAEEGIEDDPAYLATGRNGGYQAIGLARHLGAARIVLLGYDMGAGPAGEIHWHGPHPRGMNNPGEMQFRRWRASFAALAPLLADRGIETINCSRRTALDCLPRARIEDVL